MPLNLDGRGGMRRPATAQAGRNGRAWGCAEDANGDDRGDETRTHARPRVIEVVCDRHTHVEGRALGLPRSERLPRGVRGGAAATLVIVALSAIVTPLRADTATSNAPRNAAEFDEIVVVATRRETSIRDVAADVTVLDAGAIQATLSTSLAESFRYVPGIAHESSGPRFGTEGVTIRGIGGNRIAIQLDGVPLSEQFDIGRFANATRDFADTGLIDQIEVLRGPASALYGSAALGGVVAMRTLSPRPGAGEWQGTLDGLYRGADDSAHARGVLSLGGESAALLLAGSYREGGERDSAALGDALDRQDYRRDAVLAKLVGENRWGHDWRISAIRQSRDARTELRSFLGTGRFLSTTRLEGDDEQAMDLLSAEYGFRGDRVSEGVVRVFYADADFAQHTLDERTTARIERDFFYQQRLRGANLNLWWDGELGGWSHRLGLGAEFSETRTEERRDAVSVSLDDGSVTRTVLGEQFPVRDFPITETRRAGAYVSEQLDRGPLSLIVALRADDNRLTPTSDAIYAEDNPATDVVSVSESDVTPKLGVIYRIGDDVDLYLQYAEGFRAPPFEDANIGLDIPLFNIRAVPNPELRSETSTGVELGLRWQGLRSRLQLGVFRTDYEDFIESKARIGIDPQSGRLLFQSINIGEAVIRGVEARWRHQLPGALRGVSVHAEAYWAEGDNRDTDQPLNSVGPAQAVLGATWRSADARTEVTALLTATDDWSRRDETGGGLFEPAGHAVLDVYAAHTLGNRMTVRAGVGNLTDRVYWRWSEVGGLAPGDPLLPTLAESGRHVSIGLQWDW